MTPCTDAWPHRSALIAGFACGIAAGIVLLHQVPQPGGSSWPLAKLGLQTTQTVYVGILALAVNLAVVVVGTVVLRAAGIPTGRDRTLPRDYVADEGTGDFLRMAELVDGR